MITEQDRKWFDQRYEITEAEEAVIDQTFAHLYSEASHMGVKTSGDDRAASLEAALVRFIIESREG